MIERWRNALYNKALKPIKPLNISKPKRNAFCAFPIVVNFLCYQKICTAKSSSKLAAATMSDEEHHFESSDAGASKTYPQQAGTIRKNGYIVIKNRPCKVSFSNISPLSSSDLIRSVHYLDSSDSFFCHLHDVRLIFVLVIIVKFTFYCTFVLAKLLNWSSSVLFD